MTYSAEILAVVAPKVSMALYQNSVPILGSLEIANVSDKALQSLTVTMSASPSFAEAKSWHIATVEPGGKVMLSQLALTMDPGKLDALDEAQRAILKFEVHQADEIVVAKDYEIELLPKNHWGGIASAPEVLAAFVQPNDPAIDATLRRATEILRKNNKEAAISGYGSQAPRKRAYELSSAVWSAAAGLNLGYIQPPASFESTGQKVRSPSGVAENRLVTCLDSSLFLAACLEQTGLHPIVIIIQGHAFSGVWLAPDTFTTSIIDDVTALRKRIALKELIVFETTVLTHRPVPSFAEACRRGLEHLVEEKDHHFEFALDVRRARMERIKPLAKFEAIATALKPDVSELGEPEFAEAPDFPEELHDLDAPAEQTPQGRIDHWQRKLLDLSLRNSLLNFRTARAVKIDAPDAAKLEDVLASGKELKLLKRPELVAGTGVAKEIHTQRHGEDAQAAFALEALDRGELLIDLPSEKLDSQLTELYRTARSSFQEGGANTLFLALGFLSWKRDNSDDRKFRAPLVLVPVSLERKSIRSGFRLKLHDDEPRFNQTLLEMLRQDFNLSVEGLTPELPRDDSGIDLARIWRHVEQAIKDIPGWEVAREVVLSTFSFAKYLMWKDLVDRTELLKKSPVVRHLIDTPRESFSSTTNFVAREQLDYIKHPTETFCPLPADSSQLAAVMSAATGKDFVLIGPPGTGKSQTIANAISQCLAEGKKVLFVSAKTAALDVVHRRLSQMGLGDFCLEIHSAKARKTDVLNQLERALTAKGSFDNERWEREGKRLKELRDKLNVLVGKIHQVHPNGLTLFKAIGHGLKAPANVSFTWPNAGYHDRDAFEELKDIAGNLDVNGAAIGEIKDNPLSWIRTSSWSPAWAGETETAAKALAASTQSLNDAAKRFSSCLAIAQCPLLGRTRQGLTLLASALSKAAGKDWRFVLRPDAPQLTQKLQKAADILTDRRSAKQALSVEYRDGALKLDLDGLEQAWEAAASKWWLAKSIARGKIRKELLTCVASLSTSKKINCSADLAQLKVMRDKDRDLEGFGDLESKTNSIWMGLKTDTDELKEAVGFQVTVARAIGLLAEDADALSATMTAVARLLGEANALLGVGGTVSAAADAWLDTEKRFGEATARFTKLAEVGEAGSLLDELLPDQIALKANAVAANSHRLNAWCAWRRACIAADAVGIGSLAEAIGAMAVTVGGAKTAFEAAYSRWWVDAVIEEDDVLKAFSSANHERLIADFKELDRVFADLTRECIRARICAGIPDATGAKKNSELGTLNREIAKKKRHIPVRQLISEMPTQLAKLTPCLLMSPISIAQYLPADLELFDVVIFDEASQIPVWDAVGAIARAKQAIIVGDPKQMPPTNFFSRADTGGEDSDVAHEEDLESILDECLGCNLPRLDLTWHYRSRHESLIAFSNARYYKNLVTFPSPVTEDRAVSFTHITDGFYEKGGARINQGEAKAIVADIIRNLRDKAFTESKFSIGVVTFNSEQQKLIEDLLDAERRKFPEIEAHFAEDRLEPVFVKNLESVQGDERDIMYFSITYGPDRNGRISMNFGPMNQDGGPRRLNVAVTRARHALKVFSTLLPDQIDVSRTKAEGVKDLKLFLDFAKRGAKAFASEAKVTGGDYDSAFEMAVAEALRAKGWTVHPQVGVSGFRIDLGIVDPDAPGAYLAGVECDGAVYHSSATARDRDRLREEVLRGLGWNIVRIWSTDWWIDRAGAAEKAHAKLQKIIADRTAKNAPPSDDITSVKTDEEREREAFVPA